MKFAKLAVGICLTMAVAGCAGAPDLVSAPAAQAKETPALRAGGVADAPSAPPYTAFGTQHVWTTGLSVTIGQPRSLQPSETAFPQTPRTAVFTVTITNGSKSEYHPAQLAVHAVVDGKPAQEVIDSVQGLNGIGAAVRELPPGRDTTVTLAFAVPKEAVHLQLTVEPNTTDQEPSATFEGQA